MMRMRWSTPLLGLLVLVALWMYPRLPELVASHWGFDGPDGWMPKKVFVPVLVGSAAVLHLFAGGVALLRPPGRYVNLPHKSYWLAPERADATWAKLTRYADATMVLMHVIFLLVLHLSAQMSGAPVLFPLPLPLANTLFVIAIGLCCVVLPAVFLMGFRLPEQERARRKRERRAGRSVR